LGSIRLHSTDWSIDRVPGGPGRRSATPAPSFPAQFLTDETSAEEFTAQPRAAERRGGAAAGALDFSYELGDAETAILAIRHPSDALTFHLPVAAPRQGARKANELRFIVSVVSTDVATGRRGLVSKAIKLILIKVGKRLADKAISLLLPKLAAAFERAAWNKRGLRPGWLAVTRDSLAKGALRSMVPSSSERSLLLLHGTFSNAAAAFGPLAASTFFERVQSQYGGRIFAFDHFSVSETPEQNAQLLLQGLPDRSITFDVVTHSRGGLVLRNLVERASLFGPLAQRFRLGRAVLVASPNEGTPLATPTRWHDTVGFIANLLEVFPENPFTTGAEFVANALVWLARHASGDLPGLHAMDAAGAPIGELQAPPAPPSEAYSALVSNYHPSAALFARLLDAGVDQFFGSANDLVVPSEGGWRVDDPSHPVIPATRIGCFGPGGNLAPDSVTHVDFFAQRESIDFIVTALSGAAQRLAPIDPAVVLPDRRLLRSASLAAPASGSPPRIAPINVALRRPLEIKVAGSTVVASNTFHLIVMRRSESDERHAQILGQYGSARVLEPFYLGGTDDNAGRRWQAIIGYHEAIKKYVDTSRGKMPSQAELKNFGVVLFETLFPGAVRRLYDTARSLQGSERLDVVFTSTIPWVAEKPWEFAFDPVRDTSLATEELHFIRNVITAIPAEVIDDRQQLRILVVSSQPVGLGELSIAEEEAVIRRGFEPLAEAGLAEVVVLPRATPASLHAYVSAERFSVVHFIGHGEYDAETKNGYLVFQDDQGNPYRVDDRSLRQILCGRGVRLVFLNACDSGRGGHAQFNNGVAPALVAGGVPIVVANQYKVLDTSATFFAQHFYWSLAQGMALGEAAREARIAVNYSLSGESIDWAVPVVYARDPNSRLCPVLPPAAPNVTFPSVRASSRRLVAQHEQRVAVWDTHSRFPDLHTALERCNRAQTFYGFEIVDLSVPMDAWYIFKNTRYLYADKFATRLSPQISQLGVQYICAIVDEPMACDAGGGKMDYEIYSWWPAADKPPVLVFSSKGLGLAPTGATTDRALANLVVGGISGYLMARGSHENGPHQCPNYYNPERKLSVLTNAQRFCRVCLSELAKSHREELDALNAILRAFDSSEPTRGVRVRRTRR
jgi:hypothetical protein